MSENGELQEFRIEETIIVPDRDLTPAEMAKIMRQVARVANFLSSLIMKHAAITERDRAIGAGHPVCQAILAVAAQADAAAINLLPPPPQIMQPGAVPVQMPRRPS